MSLFDVKVEDTMQGRWRISITTNGYQWQTLGVAVRERDRAERIAKMLKSELAYDAQLDDDELTRLARS